MAAKTHKRKVRLEIAKHANLKVAAASAIEHLRPGLEPNPADRQTLIGAIRF
jgi:hypothetical protein